MSISTNDFKKGAKVLLDNSPDPFEIIDFSHTRPGKGRAFTTTRLKNMNNGSVTEYNITSGDKLQLADIEQTTLLFSFWDGDAAVFMDEHTFDQTYISLEKIGEHKKWIKDGEKYAVTFFKGQPFGITPPQKMTLKVTETAPGEKGNTAKSATKEAVVETGYRIYVPLFINEGDMIVVNTVTGDYDARA